ncbi:MAG: hypothetical protein ACE361_17340 [Aureliella sp.]
MGETVRDLKCKVAALQPETSRGAPDRLLVDDEESSQLRAKERKLRTECEIGLISKGRIETMEQVPELAAVLRANPHWQTGPQDAGYLRTLVGN